jgi:carbonic anhydrase
MPMKKLELIKVLNKLFDANAEFSSKHEEGFFDLFKEKQSPDITMLGCSDSRMHIRDFYKNPENAIFSIRNIGNQIVNTEGSVDFGVKILKTPFLLIVGHSDCGAVHESIGNITTNIPAVDKELEPMKLSNKDIKTAIVENIYHQVEYALVKYKSQIKDGRLTVIGAVYDFKNTYGFGEGKLILVNINGNSDLKLFASDFKDKVKYLRVLK